MDVHLFARIKTMLAEVAELPPADRPQFLDQACGDDSTLRRAVETLLARADLLPSVLQSGELDAPLAAALDDIVAAPTDPERVGPYTIQGLLGRGGMGVVYRATQQAPLQREVALKLVRPGPSPADVLARFEAERQALSRLAHPAVATVFDAGTADDGRPYFAMELVDGLPVTLFADRERLTSRERIDLFLAVAAGVQHAHQKGIIHRDLKPSNILVARMAEGWQPKIIDFGIARAVEAPSGEGLTMAGHMIGTPEYMSPEQAGVIEADVDIRTDVYALGVILYELLTGSRPHRFPKLTPVEIHRVLAGPPPPRPSTAVSSTAGAARGDEDTAIVRAAVFEARRTTADRLSRSLRGDLDNIVLKALAREPSQRYATVDQLIADLRRHLTNQPVEARAATWSYRARKFVQRHAVGVTATAAIALLLVFFTGVTVWQSAIIATERDRAREEAAAAREVSTFLAGLFHDSMPDRTQGRTMTAREMVDRGAERLETELKDQERVRGLLHRVVGEVYHAMGLYGPALAQAERSRAVLEGMASPDLRELAETLDLLSIITHDQRDLEVSERYARRVFDLKRQLYGERHPETASAMVGLAMSLRVLGRNDEAEPLYRRGLELNRELHGDDHEEVGWTLQNLGWALHAQGRVEEAEPLYREALAIQRRLFGNVHSQVAGTLNNLAGIAWQRGDDAEAMRTWQEALDILRTLYGEDHVGVGRGYVNLGHTYLAQARLDEALDLYGKGLAIMERMAGADNPMTAPAHQSVGRALLFQGRLVEAERHARAAVEIHRNAPTPDDARTGPAEVLLAQVLFDAGRGDEAEALARLAASRSDGVVDRRRSDAATMVEGLALVLVQSGRATEAVPYWRRAVDLREGAGDSGERQRAFARAGLGYALVGAGHADEGLPLLRAAAEGVRRGWPPTHPQVVRVDGWLREVNGRP